MCQVENLLDCFSQQFFIFPWYLWFPTPFYKRFENAADFIYNETRQQITEHICTRQNTTVSSSDPSLLNDLLIHTNLTPDMVEKTLFDVFLGGVDSTANAIAFLLFFLAKHESKQDRLYDEVKRSIGKFGTVDKDTIQQMPYLKACLKESFRLIFPITAGTTRSLDRDIVLRGYKIPAHTQIHLCSGISSKNSKYFEKAEDYIPERWLRGETERMTVNHFAYMPFGFGSRKCIGQTFAELDIYICVAKIIRNFQLKLPPGVTHLPYRYKTFATPTAPLDLIFQNRP